MSRTYITGKKELVLLQYSINVKKEEILSLERANTKKREEIELAEKSLEHHSAIFDEFLKENDKNAVAALAEAEHQMNLRLAKEDELKIIRRQLMRERAQILQQETQLQDCQTYREFLISLLPKLDKSERLVGRNEIGLRIAAESEASIMSYENLSSRNLSSLDDKQINTVPLEKFGKKGATLNQDQTETNNDRNPPRQQEVLTTVLKAVFKFQRRLHAKPSFPESESMEHISTTDANEVFKYFKDPQQILTILKDLEDYNLHLSQDCQDAEETFEALQKANEDEKQKNDEEIESLEERMHRLRDNLAKSEALSEPESVGCVDMRIMKEEFMNLKSNITEIYAELYKDELTPLTPVQMLAAIESTVANLTQKLSEFPLQRVNEVKAENMLKRREQKKLENMQIKLQKQEERLSKALERANAIPKRQNGRRIVFRSEPPKRTYIPETGRDSPSSEENANFE